MNYVKHVWRVNGRATKIVTQVFGLTVTYIRGKGEKPIEVSRRREAHILSQGSLYIPKECYPKIIKQVCAIFAESSRKVISTQLELFPNEFGHTAN
jgi:hypothetical protein